MRVRLKGDNKPPHQSRVYSINGKSLSKAAIILVQLVAQVDGLRDTSPVEA